MSSNSIVSKPSNSIVSKPCKVEKTTKRVYKKKQTVNEPAFVAVVPCQTPQNTSSVLSESKPIETQKNQTQPIPLVNTFVEKKPEICKESSSSKKNDDDDDDEDYLSRLDTIVRSVVEKYIDRSMFGKQKYGTTLDRSDLTILDWINHTQEELMDATLYLEKLKKTLIEHSIRNTIYASAANTNN
jgi:hypothetical protein